MNKAEKWAKPTAAEDAGDWVIRELKAKGPMPTVNLSRAAAKNGIARTTLERAKRELKDEGTITIKRYGSNTSPYIVELAGR